MIYGTDVSNWQPEKFSLTLSDGTPVDFVIIQVTRGMDGLNEKWRGQAAWARQNGLAIGFYHFGKAADAPDAQARRFWAELHARDGDQVLPGETLWYDWESSGTPSTAPTNAQKDQFIQALKPLAPKRTVGLYCNVDFWKNRDTTDFYGDALWIASWSAQGQPPVDPNIMAPWTIHQYADGPGIDHDRAEFSTREEMKVWGGKPEDPIVATMEAILRVARINQGRLGRIEAALADLDTDIVDEFVKRLTGS